MDKKFNLFVYGTLTDSHPAGMILRDYKHVNAVASGYLYALRQGFPGATFEDTAVTFPGQLILDVPETEEIMNALDRYEGCYNEPPLYTRKTVKVKTEDGTCVEAQAYEMNECLMGSRTDRINDYGKCVGWNEFISMPCESLRKIDVEHDSVKYTKYVCDLTDSVCPYHGIGKTGLCGLAGYAAKHPEKGLHKETLEAIAGMLDGCMKCNVLAGNYCVTSCSHGFDCHHVNDQLKLMYLAKRFRDRKS